MELGARLRSPPACFVLMYPTVHRPDVYPSDEETEARRAELTCPEAHQEIAAAWSLAPDSRAGAHSRSQRCKRGSECWTHSSLRDIYSPDSGSWDLGRRGGGWGRDRQSGWGGRTAVKWLTFTPASAKPPAVFALRARWVSY